VADKLRGSASHPSGGITWEGDLPAPITSYAASVNQSVLGGRYQVPASTAWTRSAVVMRKPRRKGIRYFYSHGGMDVPPPQVQPGPRSGMVALSLFQRTLVTLHDWSQNDGWFICYPRNLGWSFRVDQLKTQVTGGPGPSRSAAKPLFPRVQRVPRPSVVPRAYDTKSAKV
jgi:hypothetical protein